MMKIEQFFKLTINDKTLELTGKQLRDIANLKVKPTFIFMIEDHEFSLSEQDYNSLKSTAGSLVPKMSVRVSTYKRKVSKNTIQKIHDAVTIEWQSSQDVMDVTGMSYTTVTTTLKRLFEDTRIIKRKDPRDRKINQYKLKTHNYKPTHPEVEKIETVEESLDFSALADDRRKRMEARREH